MPRTITFVLPGRRTLSEQLPAEMIQLPVPLAEHSQYLRKSLVVHDLGKSQEQQLHLPGVDSISFRFYVEWLRTGHIDFRAAASSKSGSGGLLLRDCYDLMFAHIVGSLFKEPDFQDYIIDIMARHLDASQTPDLKVLEEIFLEKGISDVLRQFVIDRMFAVERKMLNMIRGTNSDIADNAACEYHVHEEGQCYRSKERYWHTNAILTATNDNAIEVGAHYFHKRDTQFSSSTSPSSCTTDNIQPQDMSKAVRSADSTREVHIRRFTAHSRELTLIEKPLPLVPPLTPGTTPKLPPTPSSTHPPIPPYANELPASSISSSSPCAKDRLHVKKESPSTQQLVRECLGRLPPTTLVRAQSPDGLQSVMKAPTPQLVLECLEQLHQGTKDATSPPTDSDSASMRTVSTEDTSFEDESPGRFLPKEVSACSSPILDSSQAHFERRHGGLPQSVHLSRCNKLYLRPETCDHGSSEAYPNIGFPSEDSHRESQRIGYDSRRVLRETNPYRNFTRRTEQSLQRDTFIASPSNYPYAYLGLPFPQPRVLDTQASQEILELPEHPSAHLGFSTPRLLHLDANRSQELLGSPQQHKELRPQVRDRRTTWVGLPSPKSSIDSLRQRQHHQLSDALSQQLTTAPGSRPLRLSSSSLAIHEQNQEATKQISPTGKKSLKPDSPQDSAFGISSPDIDHHQRQRYLLSTAVPPLTSAFPSVSPSVKRKPPPISKTTPSTTPEPSASPVQFEVPFVEPIHMPPTASDVPVPKVLRKPAPHRGTDWFKQQARNPWKDGTEGAEVRRSKKSLLMRVLRGNSRG